ncbi:MAG: DUF3261 domain-containing protein [Bdellovibrionota bacterium]
MKQRSELRRLNKRVISFALLGVFAGCSPIERHPLNLKLPPRCPETLSTTDRYPDELQGSYRLKFEDERRSSNFEVYVEVDNTGEKSSATLAVISALGNRVLLASLSAGELTADVSPISDFPLTPQDLWRLFEIAVLPESDIAGRLRSCDSEISESTNPSGRLVKRGSDQLIRVYTLESPEARPSIVALSYPGRFSVLITRLDQPPEKVSHQ